MDWLRVDVGWKKGTGGMEVGKVQSCRTAAGAGMLFFGHHRNEKPLNYLLLSYLASTKMVIRQQSNA